MNENKEKVVEYKFNNGLATVRVHGEFNFERALPAIQRYIQAICDSGHEDILIGDDDD